MKLLLSAGGVSLEPVRATLARRLGGLSRWELGFHRKPGKESPLARAAPLIGATAAGGTLVVQAGGKAGGKDVVLGTKLRVVGGREVEDEVRLELSESALDENHLAVHRHAHVADDGGCGQTIGDLFGDLTASVGIADDAKTGFSETPAPVLLQHDESLVDLALRVVAAYQSIPGATPLDVTGRATLRVVPADAPKSARLLDAAAGFELVAFEAVEGAGFRTADSFGRTPVVVLGRRDASVTAKALPELVKSRLGDAKSAAAELPWRAALPSSGGKEQIGTVVWARDTFAISGATLSWEQRVGVRPPGWPAPRAHAGGSWRAVFGTVAEWGGGGEPQDLVKFKLDGYEEKHDTIPVRLLTPYSGADGKGGLHLRPAPGTKAVVLVSPRPDELPLLLGNLRGPEVAFVSPSLVVPGEVSFAGGADAGFHLVARNGLKLTESKSKAELKMTADGVSLAAEGKPAAVSAKQVQVTSKSPVKVNSVEVTFQ